MKRYDELEAQEQHAKEEKEKLKAEFEEIKENSKEKSD